MGWAGGSRGVIGAFNYTPGTRTIEAQFPYANMTGGWRRAAPGRLGAEGGAPVSIEKWRGICLTLPSLFPTLPHFLREMRRREHPLAKRPSLPPHPDLHHFGPGPGVQHYAPHHPFLGGPGPARSQPGRGATGFTPNATRTRLKLALRGKRLGLSLAEIRDLIDMYDVARDETDQLTRCSTCCRNGGPPWSSSGRISRPFWPRSTPSTPSAASTWWRRKPWNRLPAAREQPAPARGPAEGFHR